MFFVITKKLLSKTNLIFICFAQEGAEVGQELDDEADPEIKFWDIPLAFNSPRHLEVLYLLLKG